MRRIEPRRTLTDSVYEAVKELVMDRRMKPGQRISIDGLARQIGVSPTPVREALARLESDGLVTKEPLKGYSISPLLKPEEREALYEFRMLLEPGAAARASERVSPEELALLADSVALMREAMAEATTGETYREYGIFAAQDAVFHETIARASGNRFILDALLRLQPHLQLYRLGFHAGHGVDSMNEHDRIRVALMRRDGAGAAAAMAEHIALSRERFRLLQAEGAAAASPPRRRRGRGPAPG